VLIAEATQLYSIGCTRFPTAAMYLLRAQFYFYFHTHYVIAGLSDLNRATNAGAAFDELFSVYYFRHLLAEKFNTQGHNQDVIAYIGSSTYVHSIFCLCLISGVWMLVNRIE
jgi:hypothetical protein